MDSTVKPVTFYERERESFGTFRENERARVGK